MPTEDRTLVVDMLSAAREALLYAGDHTGPELDRDRMRLLAIVRLLEVTGEAAASVSTQFREEHPEIPWRQIIATRNRLIHGYQDVDSEVVASISATNLPALVAALDQILG